MINRKDLRIGNFVELSGEIKPVEAIGYDKISVIGRYWWDDQLNPIPLTEEILIKCGCKQSRRGFIIKKFTIRKEMELGNTFSVNCSGVTLTTIEYFHELQNIVFDLEGQELNYQTQQ